MKAWWTSQELAGLPGIPASDRNVRIWGNQGRIEGRRRQIGKGMEYSFASLPLETRRHICIVAGEPEPTDGDHLRDTTQLIRTTETAPQAPQVADLEAIRDEIPVPPIETQLSGADIPLSATSLKIAAPIVLREQPTEADRRRAKSEAAAKWAALPPDSPKRARAKAREWLCFKVDELRREQPGLKQAAAIDGVCERVNAGELALPEHVAPWVPARTGAQSLTPNTLYRWTRAYAEQGRWGLTDGYGNRRGACAIEAEPALYRAVLGQMLRNPQATGRDLFAWLHTVEGITVPPLRSVQRFREHWTRDNHQLWMLVTNPGKWKNHFQVAFGSQHEQIERLNQLWELDSTPGDWLLTDGRHTVVGCIDLWSRRLKLRVSRSSSGFAVGQCFRSAVLDWGVPETARTDNGADYVGDYFSGVLHDLEVTQELCIPFASEQKGTIERALKSVCYGLAKLLPGYIGHNVAEREAIRARETFAKRIMTPGELVSVELSAADLQSALDRWLEHIYHQDPHAGEGMKGLAPVAKAASWTGSIRTVEPRALDSLLAPLTGRPPTIQKKGIRWNHHWYISPLIAEFIGDPVLCRYDEADLGRLFVYRNSAFLCCAEAPELTGISRAEVAAVARATQNKAKAKHAAELRAIKKEVTENAAEAVLRHRAEAAGKLVAFPQPQTPYSTAALAAGAQAAAAAAGPAPRVQTAAQADAQVRIAADLAGGNVAHLPDSPIQRYKRWLTIQRDAIHSSIGDFPMQDLGPYTAADLAWWDGYAESSEYRAQKRLAADYPEVYGLAGSQEDGD